MQQVLPGGATLGGCVATDDERQVACRPGAAVIVRTRPRKETAPPPPPQDCLSKVKRPLKAGKSSGPAVTVTNGDWLSRVERVLKVLAVLVGLISAILALFGWSRK